MTTVNWTLVESGSWNRPARWASNVGLSLTRYAGKFTLKDASGVAIATNGSFGEITAIAKRVIEVRDAALAKTARVIADTRRQANQAIADAGRWPNDVNAGIRSQARRTLAQLSVLDLPDPTVLSSAERAKYAPQACPGSRFASSDRPSSILRSPGFRRFSPVPGGKSWCDDYDYDYDYDDYDDDDCCDREYCCPPVRRTLVNGPRFRRFAQVPSRY